MALQCVDCKAVPSVTAVHHYLVRPYSTTGRYPCIAAWAKARRCFEALRCPPQEPAVAEKHALGALVFAVLDPGGHELEQQAQRVLVEVRRHTHRGGELRPPLCF